MNVFSGIVTLDGEEVPVTVGLDNERVNLVSGEMEIGDWSTEECSITPGSDGRWLIAAESETLTFAPGRPDLFARAISEQAGESLEDDDAEETQLSDKAAEVQPEAATANPDPTPEYEEEETVEESEVEKNATSSKEFEVVDGPPPRSATMIGFYVLAGITAILGVWAVFSIL